MSVHRRANAYIMLVTGPDPWPKQTSKTFRGDLSIPMEGKFHLLFYVSWNRLIARDEARAKQAFKMQITIVSVSICWFIDVVFYLIRCSLSGPVTENPHFPVERTGLGGVAGCCGVVAAPLHPNSKCRHTRGATHFLLRILLRCHGLTVAKAAVNGH